MRVGTISNNEGVNHKRNIIHCVVYIEHRMEKRRVEVGIEVGDDDTDKGVQCLIEIR